MEFNISAVARQRLQDTFSEGVSEAAKSLRSLASELDDDLLSNDIAELRSVVEKINHKVCLFHQITKAKVEQLEEFSKLYSLDIDLVKESFNKLSVVGPTQPAALQLVSILEVEPPLSYITLKLRSRLEPPLPSSKLALTSFPSPSDESCAVAPEELFNEPDDDHLDQLVTGESQSQGIQDEDQYTITVQDGPPPQAVPLPSNNMSTSPTAATPISHETPSVDTAPDLLQQMNNKTIESHRLMASEFTFINVAYMSNLYILRCPDPECVEHHFEKHPFRWQRGVKHFDKFHPEVFGGEAPSEQFVFDNFAIKVNGVTASDVKARWKTKKCRVDLSKSKPYRREQVPSAKAKTTSSQARRPMSPSSDSGSTILGADDEIPNPPRKFSELHTGPAPLVDRTEPSARSPNRLPRNVEVYVLEDSSDDDDSDEYEENLDHLDSEFRPPGQSDASKPSCEKGSSRPGLSLPTASHEPAASSQSSPTLSRKRGRTSSVSDDDPKLIITLKTPRLDEVRTTPKNSNPLPEEGTVKSSRQYSDPLPRRFARN